MMGVENLPEIEKTILESKIPNQYIEYLLDIRKRILNKAFVLNDQNIKRLDHINEYLRSLTIKLYDRVEEIVNKLDILNDNPEFPDFEIEGTLTYNYNDEDSVLKLDDDKLYNSDFEKIINVIDDIEYRKSIISITQHGYNDARQREFYINSKCSEYPWHDIPLDICYATHYICSHSLYSIPDLIRLNDFWVEVNYKSQCIVEQPKLEV